MEAQPFSIRGLTRVPTKIFYPQQTVRCVGPAAFRNQLARDVACLLDLDEDVTSWSCFSEVFSHGSESFRPDLVVDRENSCAIIQANDRFHPAPSWLPEAVLKAGYQYQLLAQADLPAIRLRNAKDLLRYARYDVPLDDRVRLLAALDEHGTLTVAECLTAFRSVSPLPGLASLILGRIVTVDLDEILIGPETAVRRHRG